jgi:copper homeostasis protein
MKFELCAASLEAVSLAVSLGFDRIELCQNLEQGGVTPSYGMIEYAIACGIETHVLIRPRPGGFIYTTEEVEVMIREIINCRSLGVKGIVVGAMSENGGIDTDTMKKIMKKAYPMSVTFHRAFDDCIHWEKSLNGLIDLGVHRILSSGLARNVEQGLPILKKMIAAAGQSIEIMPGGGINAANVKKIIEELQPESIHFSATKKIQQDEKSLFSETMLCVDERKAKRILEAASNAFH